MASGSTAAIMQLVLPLCLLIMSAAAPSTILASSPATAELPVASREMQAANYYTFVMLLNMVQDRIPSNTAFFMPSDRLLSEVTVTEDKVLEFLARHSVPSPILFDHLRYLPTGTLIPTNRQGYMLRVSNAGSKNYHLNDVQVTKPNICTAGAITCHGISGVLSMRIEADSLAMGGRGGNGGNCTEASLYAPELAPSIFHAEHADPFETEKKKKNVEKEHEAHGGQSPSKSRHHYQHSSHKEHGH